MLRPKLSKIRRKAFEAVGLERYSRPSLFEIDKKLEKYLPYRNGFFIEVGANDGYRQSNTYYFERFKGWKGILVEGIPELYQKCVVERPNSRVFNYALVDRDCQDPTVTMNYANLMSLVRGALKTKSAEAEHIEAAIRVQGDLNSSYEIRVPTRTLTSILDECQVEQIDLFSLDVEGFELNVLKGLDFNKYRPKYILIEAIFNKAKIDAYITDFYTEIDKLSKHDYLYQSKDM